MIRKWWWTDRNVNVIQLPYRGEKIMGETSFISTINVHSSCKSVLFSFLRTIFRRLWNRLVKKNHSVVDRKDETSCLHLFDWLKYRIKLWSAKKFVLRLFILVWNSSLSRHMFSIECTDLFGLYTDDIFVVSSLRRIITIEEAGKEKWILNTYVNIVDQ